MNAPHAFWLLWSPTGPTPPRNRHASESEAKRVATDMAVRHPGQEFFVVKATTRVLIPPFAVIDELVDPPLWSPPEPTDEPGKPPLCMRCWDPATTTTVLKGRTRHVCAPYPTCDSLPF